MLRGLVAHHDLVSGKPQRNLDVILIAVSVVMVRDFHDHLTAHDLRRKGAELFDTLMDSGLG